MNYSTDDPGENATGGDSAFSDAARQPALAADTMFGPQQSVADSQADAQNAH